MDMPQALVVLCIVAGFTEGRILDPCSNFTVNTSETITLERVFKPNDTNSRCKCHITSTPPQSFKFAPLITFSSSKNETQKSILRVWDKDGDKVIEAKANESSTFEQLKNTSKIVILFSQEDAQLEVKQTLVIDAAHMFTLSCGEGGSPPDLTDTDKEILVTAVLTTILLLGIFVAVVISVLLFRKRRASASSNHDTISQSAPATSSDERGRAANQYIAMTAQEGVYATAGAASPYELAGPGSPISVYSTAQSTQSDQYVTLDDSRHLQRLASVRNGRISAIYDHTEGTELYHSLQRNPTIRTLPDNIYSHCSSPNMSSANK